MRTCCRGADQKPRTPDAAVVELHPPPPPALLISPPRRESESEFSAPTGLEEQARATAEAAYKRGAKFVDVAYFDPYVKRARIEHADPDTLGFVPQWFGKRVLECAEQNGARINLRGVTAPNLMDGLDKSLLGKDTLPSVKETFKVIDERSTN
jgi:aminopeptidase